VAIVKVTQGNHKLYHVQQGPYETAALAKSFQQRLEKRGIISVIQKASV
jgi:cell division protein FtsN